jgi:hypothetical protein
LNALDTESFRMRIKKDFGLELNLTGDDQYGNAAAVAD